MFAPQSFPPDSDTLHLRSALRAAAFLGLSFCLLPAALAQGALSSVGALAAEAGATPAKARALGEAFTQSAKLTAGDAAQNSDFGTAVSLSGERALVGATGADSFTGSAYVFDYDGTAWTQTAKLTADDAGANDQFGWSVSLLGDRAIVGARFNGSGTAYVFEFDGSAWAQTATLVASDAAEGDWFGNAVSLSDSQVLIGAPAKNSLAGVAYVFDYDGTAWAQSAVLAPADGAAFDFFSSALTLAGDRALIGAVGKDSFTGAAYVFSFDGTTWAQTAKLTAADGAGNDQLGNSVSLSGDRVLLGAPGDNGSAGSAYVFGYDGTAWSQTTKLAAGDRAAGDQFGAEVALWGDRALIGSAQDDDAGSSSGSAYLFDYDGTAWAQSAKLVATDASGGSGFGSSVSLMGERALIGASAENGFTGSVYVFDGMSEVGTEEAARGFELSSLSPNPASSTSRMTLQVEEPQQVEAALYDALGRQVAVLYSGRVAGRVVLDVSTVGLPSGVYTARIVVGTFAASRRLVVVQ